MNRVALGWTLCKDRKLCNRKLCDGFWRVRVHVCRDSCDSSEYDVQSLGRVTTFTLSTITVA